MSDLKFEVKIEYHPQAAPAERIHVGLQCYDAERPEGSPGGKGAATMQWGGVDGPFRFPETAVEDTSAAEFTLTAAALGELRMAARKRSQRQKLDAEGKPAVDADGNPVMEDVIGTSAVDVLKRWHRDLGDRLAKPGGDRTPKSEERRRLADV